MTSHVTLVGNLTREGKSTNARSWSCSMTRENLVVPALLQQPGTRPNLTRRSEMGNRTPRASQHTDLSVQLAQRVTSFWSYVDIGDPEECWLWKGYVEKGYGEFYFDGHMVGAHELALTFTTGEKRHPSLDTCHACDTPLCCNPAHLRFDTRQANVDDAISRDRHTRGERSGKAKLTDSDVLLIRQRAALGATGKALAMEFGVGAAYISNIVHGRNWKHVGGPLREQHGNHKHGRYAK